MRVVRYDRFAGIDGLYLEDAPIPDAAPGHAVVQIRSTCINPGSLSALHGSSYVPVRDLSGTVVAVGADVSGLEVGTEALGWLQDWAAHAEYAAVPADQLIEKPAELPWDIAGSLFVTPMAGLAGVQAVQPREGETLVVAGASGGVGLTAVQLARRDGATVFGIAGPANAARLADLGAIPVPYGDGLAATINRAANGKVDAFLDAYGSGYIDLALELGVPPQRIATVVDYRGAQDNGVRATGTMQAGGRAALRKLAELAAAGELQVPIAATFALADVQAAYRRVADDRPFGRVVLHPQGPGLSAE
jgi:NADPH:quinone reductase-like Zn-dependent oxidoreductase